MMRSTVNPLGIACVFVLAAGCASQQPVVPDAQTGKLPEVKITAEHIDNAHTTSEFKFKTVPPPAANDAAAHAKITIVSGTQDANGGGVEVLNDGNLPHDADDPAANCFFNEGTDGGRLSIDLGSVIDVKQFNAYSWHPNTRGPQVFKLYGSDGSAFGFKAAPANGMEPEKVGWRFIATVDTRPKLVDGSVTTDDEAMGGQYGVSIFDENGGAIGKYRYLLMIISRTEDRDDWGNTFFSEIDVVK
jgi:hypothetical protein